MNKKYIASIILFLVLIYLSLIILNPIKGQVVNALDGKPVSNAQVIRTVETIPLVINPGGNNTTIAWQENTKTDGGGNYDFPWSVHFIFPLFMAVDSVNINVPICPTQDIVSKLTLKPLFDNENCMQYQGVDYQNKKMEEGFNFNTFFYDRSSKTFAYDKFNKLVKGHLVWSGMNDGRLGISSKLRDIYLIPKVNEIVACDGLTQKELVSECKRLNADRIAIKSGDTKICQYSSYVSDCVRHSAMAYRDENKCDEIITLLSNKAEYEKIVCERSVATEKEDKQMCLNIPESKWIEKSNTVLHAFCESDYKLIGQ